MRTIIAIAKKELTIFLTTPWAWIVFTFFSFVASTFFMSSLTDFRRAHADVAQLSGGWSQVEPEFQFLRNLTDGVVMPTFSAMLMVMMFLVPVLSARLFADERRQKTFELLMTSPVSTTQIVIGKYLGGLALVSLTVGLMLLYPAVLSVFGTSFSAVTSEKTATLEWPTVLLGFLGLLVWGAAILAIGTFISSLTESVIVAIIVTFCVSLLLLIVRILAPSAGEPLRSLLEYASFEAQLRNFMRGVFDLRPLVFFGSLIAAFLVATHRSVESRRWV
jgi:ABC-2 type transport system permease protein